jgi:hypothetical protein
MTRRPKRREHGIWMVTPRREGWQPMPTPEEARARFAELVDAWRSLSDDYTTTARLVIAGEIVEEAELQGERPRSE